MIKVGLTGGIGSGKTLVSTIFSKLGIPVYDSDSATKALYLTDKNLKTQLIKAFGTQTYFENGKLNRSYLGQLVFNDQNLLNKLNKIVHPRVKADFEAWVLKNNQAKYIIKEAAILIESGAYKQVDKVILVSAPLELRIERVLKRDKTSRNEVLQRINKQLPENELLKFTDYVIKNDQMQAILPQVISVHKQLLLLK